MGQTTDKIENYIDDRREDLGSNFQELEQKVKSATDWRYQFQNNPMTMLGVAFGGGVLLATLFSGSRRPRYNGSSASESHALTTLPHASTDRQKTKALETIDNIKGALIGVAAARVKDFIAEVVPGFHEQLRRTENQRPKLPA